jgi:hypothetical protein
MMGTSFLPIDAFVKKKTKAVRAHSLKRKDKNLIHQIFIFAIQVRQREMIRMTFLQFSQHGDM